MRPTSSPLAIFSCKNAKGRWLFGASPQIIQEGDVALFLDEAKRQRKRLKSKILISLGGIEQNAKLMAQEAKIQIWSLRVLNRLFDFYNLPKMILFPQQESHEPPVGALA